MKTIIQCAQCWILLALLAWWCAPAAALVVTPYSDVHANEPTDNPGWKNVGDKSIYLGNRWAITANHVGPATTTFSTGTFFYEAGTAVRLKNPDNSDTDLLVYRLTADPGLPWLAIASSTPAVGAEVTLIGDGLSIGPDDGEQYWIATPNTSPPPTNFWMQVSETDSYNKSGYTASDYRKLWGTNLVEDDQDFFENESEEDGDFDHTVLVDYPFGRTYSFFTEFDKAGVTDGDVTGHEAQAESEDSGSATFAKEDGKWVLAGVTYAIGVFDDQPGIGSTAMYGNLTFMGDLAFYRDQILSITGVPEPSGFWLVGGVGAMVGLARLAVRRRRAC